VLGRLLCTGPEIVEIGADACLDVEPHAFPQVSSLFEQPLKHSGQERTRF
jgi:hypothetical protein